MNSDIMLKIYKAFILPHFYYCSCVWHFCSIRNSEKLEALSKRILKVIFNDYSSTYNQLLDKARTISLNTQRIYST